MPAAPRPSFEHDRLEALLSLKILDTAPSEYLDTLVQAASKIMKMPIAAISLIAEERQWFKSICGWRGVNETPRNHAFCAYTILDSSRPCLIEDAVVDWRVLDNPLVTGSPYIRSYAGAPLLDKHRLPIGTLCFIDYKPRTFSDADVEKLMNLAGVVSKALRLHSLTHVLRKAQFM